MLTFPNVTALRPTPDRVRETLFNWLGQTLQGLRCLDLFCGSGALGFEAASRGAEEVVLVDSSLEVEKATESNLQRLAAKNIHFICQPAETFLSQNKKKFDLVFLDPPFRTELLTMALEQLPKHLSRNSKIYVESSGLPGIPSDYVEIKRGKAGQVTYMLLEFVSNNEH